MIWALQDAKNKFSELVERAIEDGPQTVTKHGHEAVVVVSVAEYKKLNAQKSNLADFFRRSPLVGSEVDLSRVRDTHTREINL
jgi:prevent-host-death family protein